MQPCVIIIGAGLGGLCLAQHLKKASIPCRIFERDLKADWRAQGYRISVPLEAADAIRKCLPDHMWELFEKTALGRSKGFGGFNALDASTIEQSMPTRPAYKGVTAPSPNAGAAAPPVRSGPAYMADRTVLRTLLTFGLEDYIEYGKKFVRCEKAEQGMTAHFSDGTYHTSSIMIAADGANSAVRRHYLPEHCLYDTHLRCFYGKSPLTEELREKYNSEAMSKTAFIRQDEISLYLLADPVLFQQDPHSIDARMHHADDYVYWALVANTKMIDISDSQLFDLSPEHVSDIALQLTHHWHPSLRSVLELQDKSQTAVIRMHTAHPVIPEWESDPHITFIGDAAHTMLPTGGSGATTAFIDAAKLGDLLVQSNGRPTAETIAQFERELRQYGGEKVKFSILGGGKIFPKFPTFEDCTPIRQW
ncbi:hypothetical protein PROFUN_12975 [Planoprotostelium fungivorum]|uniref:FAD-binding domain-containing protein n=1 Tax=Planoprotostelium fungivorum TaxID=1890364 RepID=A0A2P6MZJ7_9EUKA|nr:hypothetical protein PROFUN_12975 [Planoprotostelium fungivorum]